MLCNFMLELLPSFTENLIILSFMTSYLKFKSEVSKKVRFHALFMTTLLLCLMSSIVDKYLKLENMFVILAILVCVLYAYLFLNGTFINYFFTALIPFVVITIINALTLYLFSYISGESIRELLSGSGTIFWTIIIITKGSLLFVTSFIIRLSPRSDFVFKKSEVISIISIFFASLLIALFIFNNQVRKEEVIKPSSNIYFVLALGGLVVINILTFVSYLKIERDNKERIKYELVKLQLEQQKLSYEEFERRNLEIRKIRHDMRNYMEACLALMQSGEYNKAESYLENIYTNEIKPIEYAIVTDSSLINALLNNKLHVCKTLNIEVSYKIIANFRGFDELDICILLGNLLNNAIEAVKNYDTKKCIRFEVFTRKGYLVIVLSNTIFGSILNKNPKLLTTKEDKKNHGLGMLSIKDIVNKYNGMLNIEEKCNDIEFQITLKCIEDVE